MAMAGSLPLLFLAIARPETGSACRFPGTGKTHLATALGISACQRGKRVRFCRVTELINSSG